MRIACQQRFLCLNVIIRVSVKGKRLVAILLLGHNVATAIFQNGCQIQYPPILINTACRAIIVVCESIFQIYNYLATPAFTSAIFKDGGRQYKCPHVSNTASPRAILLTLLDSLVDSDIKYIICHLQ